MKAMICRRWGGPDDLRLEEIERPVLKSGQVRIKIRAAGVSFATTLVIAGKYQRKPPLPFAPGTEVSGVVIEVDPACKRLKVGDEVVAVLDWGGLAEEAVAHEVNVFPKPRTVGFVEAVQLAISYPTSAGALTWPMALDVQKGQTLLVHAAAGGVGMAAVEIGKILGATVIATAGGARKADFAKAHGADHVIDYRATDFRDEVLRLTNGRGVDRIYDPVGGDVFTQSLRCLAVEGRICPIGFASGTIPQIPANILLVKSIAVMGFNYGYYVGWSPHDARFEQAGRTLALMERIRGWCDAGLCHPHVDRTFRLDQAAEAMRALLERSVAGRVAVIME
ncbi:NADPH2:quinone reductase [Enhydrobacter aerosaccus]|uniref:NADPH2:quinone reductase n=1 Tax=Enhydrobacter aerosaccus TaxID=225324 RepID=A0A1T4JRS8_9HYPH|nr:NADPH:quinone oxidoreductase family protein [Enhydrobacter aerosaccus]SJZ32902.1 NADPH2:quinone reductase [Enhydrobacter aerosaccus]